jgi:hypothetical protein
VGEAIRLQTGDVKLDHTPPQLHILETKFHKSRLVPLSPCVSGHLRAPPCPVFPSRLDGAPLRLGHDHGERAPLSGKYK